MCVNVIQEVTLFDKVFSIYLQLIDMENDKQKLPMGNIKAFVIEVVLIVGLTIVIVAVLNYFKVIDLGALIVDNTVATPEKVASLPSAPVKSGGAPIQNKVQVSKFQQDWFTISKNKAMKVAFTVYDFEAKIVSVDTKKGYDEAYNSGYSVKIVVSVGTAGDKVTLLYPEQAIKKIKVVDSKKKELTFSDLKAGDGVVINTNLGTLRQYPNNFNSVVITKQ